MGYFGYFSNFCSQFLVACDKVGIPSVPDVNTATCSLGATKVSTCKFMKLIIYYHPYAPCLLR